MPNTIRLHRVLRATPERVYRAFLDPDAKAKWLPPHGFTGKVHEMDARVGGTYKMSFTNFTTGKTHSSGGRYLELEPNERIRYSDWFDDPGNHCHRILMQGVRGAHKQHGRVRHSQNWVSGSCPTNAVFVPPPPERVADLLGNLERYIHADDDLAPLLRIALVHAQFETIHPYP